MSFARSRSAAARAAGPRRHRPAGLSSDSDHAKCRASTPWVHASMSFASLTGVRAWPGSVSSAVARHTARPTLVVPPPVEASGWSEA
jgi:hypothetical protein